MLSLTDFIKYKLAPPKLYLAYSATRKYKRARKKGELELHLLPFLADPKKAAIDIGANKGLYTTI